MNKMKIRYKYFFYGFLFGLMFPIGALIVEFSIEKIPFSADNIKFLHENNMLLYMIDSAPIFLGLFALIGGLSKEKSVRLLDTLLKLSGILNEKNDKLLKQSRHTMDFIQSTSIELSDLMNKLNEDNMQIISSCQGNKEAYEALDETTSNLIKTFLEQLNLTEKINGITREFSKEIEVFFNHVDQLSSNINSIDQIGFEINLLSLNSGIEANKMGEAASSFSVIAKQIKDLSDKISGINKTTEKLSTKLKNKVNNLQTDIQQQDSYLKSIEKVSSELDSSIKIYTTNLKTVMDNMQANDVHIHQRKERFSVLKKQIDEMNHKNSGLVEYLFSAIHEESNILSDINKITTAD